VKLQFRLVLQVQTNLKPFDIMAESNSYDELHATSFVELLSKFLILITSVQKRIHDDMMRELAPKGVLDDDIPF